MAKKNLEYFTEFDWEDVSCGTYNPIWSPDDTKIVLGVCSKWEEMFMYKNVISEKQR